MPDYERDRTNQKDRCDHGEIEPESPRRALPGAGPAKCVARVHKNRIDPHVVGQHSASAPAFIRRRVLSARERSLRRSQVWAARHVGVDRLVYSRQLRRAVAAAGPRRQERQ